MTFRFRGTTAFVVLMLLGSAWVGSQGVETPQALLETATADLTRAVERYDQASIAGTADTIRRVIELNPRYAEAHLRLAEALMWLDSYGPAQASLDRARSLGFSGTNLPLLEARLAVLDGRLDDADDLYAQVLQRQPYNEEARVGRAVLSLAAGDTPASLRGLRSLEQRYPANQQLLLALMETSYAAGNQEEYRRYLSLALQYHGDSASVQLAAAQRALEEGAAARARFYAANATELAPTLEAAWIIRARSAFQSGEPAAALEHYETLLTLNPNNHRAWFARGELLSRMGESAAAQRSWERALEVRRDYEIARIAFENHALSELPLDDPVRAALAERYRSSGAALDGRFLSRQAEQQYRRGLRMNPFDGVLRVRLAELYLRRGMEARYLQELEVLAARYEAMDDPPLERSEVEDRIALYTARRRSAVATRWQVDQFTAPRPRTAVMVVARQTADTVEPAAAQHLAEYTGSLLQGSQNITLLGVDEHRGPLGEAVSAARSDGAQLLVSLVVHLGARDAAMEIEVIDTDSAQPVFAREFRRSGNNRLDQIVREASEAIVATVPARGQVLARDFQRLLVSLGGVDGIEVEQQLPVVSSTDGSDLGTGTVVAVDDLLAELRYETSGTDRLVIGDVVFPVPEEVETDGTTQPDNQVASAPAQDDQTFMLTELVQRVFRLR